MTQDGYRFILHDGTGLCASLTVLPCIDYVCSLAPRVKTPNFVAGVSLVISRRPTAPVSTPKRSRELSLT